jgi:dipeptidyl aminopeptidase/acylaminoacyl peptidase
MVSTTCLIALTVASSRPTISIPDIVEVADIASLSVSPDRRLIAFRVNQASIARNGYEQQWYVQPIDGSAAARFVGDGGGALLTDAGTVVSTAPVWAPSSGAIYYRALIDGEVQVWRARVDGAGAERVTSDPANVRSIEQAPDGTLAYEVGASREAVEAAERAADDRGVLVDARVDPVLPLSHGGIVDGRPASLRFTGSWFDRGPLLFDAPIRRGSIRYPREDRAAAAAAGAITLAPVHVVGPSGTEGLKARLADGRNVSCSSTPCRRDHISSASLLPDGRDVLVTTSDVMRRQSLFVWTPSTASWRTLVHSEGLLSGDSQDSEVPCAAGLHAVICVAATPSGPPRLVGIDIRNGRQATLLDPNSALRKRALPTHLISWRTKGGVPFGGVLALPSGRLPPNGYPIVINYYACEGFLRGGLGDEQPMMPLAEHGIASLCINQTRDPLANSSRPRQLDAAVAGVEQVVDNLSKRGIVDRSRVGMAGLSFGSEVALAVAQRTSLLRVASISSGQIEPYYYWVNHLPGRDVAATLRDWFRIGDPDTDQAGWRAYAPVRDVAHIRTPLLMQLPESEMRLSMELYSRLANSSTPVEMTAFANETHVKYEPRHKLSVYDRNLDWFRYWLLGEEDPDPAKVAQYARWHSFSERPGFTLPVAHHPAP